MSIQPASQSVAVDLRATEPIGQDGTAAATYLQGGIRPLSNVQRKSDSVARKSTATTDRP